MGRRLWMIVLLVGGLVGVAGFFLPLAVAPTGDGTESTSISAVQIVAGSLHAHGRYRGVDGARVLAASAFVPALLLFAFGAIGAIRGRLPRTVGGIAMLLGVASAALWGVMLEACRDTWGTHLGLGAHVLLVAGLAGMAAGVATIVAPGPEPASNDPT